MAADENTFARGPRRHPSALGVRKQHPGRHVLAPQSVNIKDGDVGKAELKRPRREPSDAFLRKPLRPVVPQNPSRASRTSPRPVTRKASMAHELSRGAPSRYPVLFPRPSFPKNLGSLPVDLPAREPPDLDEDDTSVPEDSVLARKLFAPEVYALAQSAAQNCLDDLPSLPLV